MFPPGWSFVFNSHKKRSLQHTYKLCLYAPSERHFFSVQSAFATNQKALVDVDINAVFQYLGIPFEQNKPICSVKRNDDKNASRRCSKGTRVFARYHLDSWYWGVIKTISSGFYFTCTVSYFYIGIISLSWPIWMYCFSKIQVLFDDGDELNGLQFWEVLTIEEYKRHMKRLPVFTDTNVSYIDASRDIRLFATEHLQVSRCKKCTQCIKEDCGNCTSCRDNNGSTSPRRQVCLFKVCTILFSHWCLL